MKDGYLDITDLRVGNHVLYGDKICTVQSIMWGDVLELHILDIPGVQEEGAAEPLIDRVHPIPLTEEILLDFGFESVEGDSERYNPEDKFKDNFEYRLDVGIFYRDLICKPALGWYVFIQDSDMIEKGNLKSKNIYFLHELQNLYFAITGKELEVKL